MRKLLNITMGIALLVSTMGFSITQHFCHGDFVGASVLGNPDTCCDGKTKMPANCCHNEIEFHKVDDDFASSSFAVPLPPDISAPLPVAIAPAFATSAEIGKPEYLNYKPPLILHPDICIWVQSFLI